MQWSEPILQAYVREVKRDHPVGFWPLWDAVPQATDQSGGGNPGTFSGGYTLGQPGPFAGARGVQIDGSTGYVLLPAASFASAADMTVCGWFRLAAVGNVQYLFAQSNSGNNANFDVVFQASGQLQINQYNGGSGYSIGAPTNLSVGAWCAFAATRSGASVNLYVNGQMVATGGNAFTYATGTTVAVIGANYPQMPRYSFAGTLSLFEYHSRVLSPARIAAHYAVATGRQRVRRTYSIGNPLAAFDAYYRRRRSA